MAHTKGPWKKTGIISDATRKLEYWEILDEAENYSVCKVAWFPDGNCKESQTANADLIAAAPELLEACKESYIRILQLDHNPFRFSPKTQMLMCRLRDVLALALGQDKEFIQNEFESQATARKAQAKAEGKL